MDYRNLREAVIKYGASDFQVVAKGNFVKCGYSGRMILLENLHYWSAERQEAYWSSEESFAASHGSKQKESSI